MRKKPWLIGTLVAILLIAIGALIFFGTNTSEEICAICGQTQTVRRFEIPRTNITVFTYTSMHPSRVGKVIAEAKLIGVHDHVWKNIYTVGNGKPMTFGSGHDTAKNFNKPDVANYLQSISGFETKETIAKYIGSLQDASHLDSSDNGAPASFTNESLLEQSKHKDELSDLLEQKAKAEAETPKP